MGAEYLQEVCGFKVGERVTAGEVLDLVRRLHYRTQDFEEGDIEDRILAHSVYELREVPLDQIEEVWSFIDDG